MVRKLLSGAVAGTSAMTLFSYYLSYKTDKQFKEPVLLNQLLRISNRNSLAGWNLHYLIGFLFTAGSHSFWKCKKIDPTFHSGLLLGLMYGFIGILGWHILFKLHSNPPSIKLRMYFFHLLAAHVIFGLGSTAGYKLLHR